MTKKQNLSHTTKYFNEEAAGYDSSFIRQTVPLYDEMLISMGRAIKVAMPPLEARVLDLGIGTGTTSKVVLDIAPYAQIKGYDTSPKMIKEAKKKLSGYNIKFVSGNVRGNVLNLKPTGDFDVAVSSLTYHHLEDEKKEGYRKVFDALKPEGTFVLGDIIRYDNPNLNKQVEKDWIEYMLREGGEKYTLGVLKHTKDRKYSTVNENLDYLRDVGFETEVIWMHMITAVLNCKKL